MRKHAIRSKLQSQQGSFSAAALLSAFSALLLASTLMGMPNVLSLISSIGAQQDVVAPQESGEPVSPNDSLGVEVVGPSTSDDAVPAENEGINGAGEKAVTSVTSDSAAGDTAAQDASVEVAETAQESHTLEATLASVDGNRYVVRVSYDDQAAIPDGAVLSVVELNQMPSDWNDEQKQQNEYKDRPTVTERLLSAEEAASKRDLATRTLEVGENGNLVWNKLLSLSLDAGGSEVVPQSKLKVQVELEGLQASESDALEVALLDGNNSRKFDVSNETALDDAHSHISFETDRLGELCIAEVAERKFSWNMHGDEVNVYGARSVQASPSEIPLDLEYLDGLRLIEVFGVAADPVRDFGTTMWIEAHAAEGAGEGYDSVLGYSLAGADPQLLFDANGTNGLVPFSASDAVALVWDSGFRDVALRSGDVVATGEMPIGTAMIATNVTPQYADAQLTDGAETVAAYDVSMQVDGAEWQPSEVAPVRMAIGSEGIDATDGDSVYEVLRIDDAGEPVAVPSGTFGSSVAFDATASGTYVVVRYTVDFHLGDLSYSIAGESEILLSQLLERLGVTEFTVSDVTGVAFSNESLVAVERVEGDWKLTSLAPFSTDELLTLTLVSGKVVTINVTDDQATVYTVGESGYATLQAAIDAIESGSAGVIELASDYDMLEGCSIPANKEITIVSASSESPVTIRRGYDGAPLFTINGKSKLTFDNIVVDGQKDSHSCNAKGGLVQLNASGAELTVGKNAELKDSKVDDTVKGTKDGQPIYEDGVGGAIWLREGSSLTMEGSITGCKAIQGGGIYAEAKAISIEVTGKISGCIANGGGGGAISVGSEVELTVGEGAVLSNNRVSSAYNTGRDIPKSNGKGGAIYTDGSVKIDGGTLSENSADRQGGAIYVTNKGDLELVAGEVRENSAQKGGAIYVNGATTITDGSLVKNMASDSGGALYVSSGAKAALTINGGTITENRAVSVSGVVKNGGAIFTEGSVTITNGSMTGNTAAKGSAICVGGSSDSAKVFLNGDAEGAKVSIGDNVASDGGGIDFTNDSGKIYFSGNVVVHDNKDASDSQKNVVLEHDSNGIMNTMNSGLSSTALIGIYVVDEQQDGHGTRDAVFGTCGTLAEDSSAYSDECLDMFINDRDPSLRGTRNHRNNEIHWDIYICKVNDKDDRPLFKKDSAGELRRAVYNLLGNETDSQGAFAELLPDNLYYEDDSKYGGHEFIVKMLVDYTLPDKSAVNVKKESCVATLTTSELPGECTDGWPYMGKTDRATIYASAADGRQSMFVLGSRTANHAVTLTLRDIILDGQAMVNAEEQSVSGPKSGDHGSIINVRSSNAILNIRNGATLQNAATTKGGGAVCVWGTLNMSGGLIQNCYADGAGNDAGGGAVYIHSSGAKVFNLTGGTIKDCYAKNGGAVANNTGTLNFSGGTIEGCTASSNGGGIYLPSGTANLTGGSVKSCTATNGGGMCLAGSAKFELTDKPVFVGNSATNGGAFYAGENSQLSMTSGTLSSNTAEEGAAIALGGSASFTMSGGLIEGNASTIDGAGGAVAVKSDVARVTFTGSPIVHANFNTTTKQQQNVVLDHDSNAIINSKELGSDALIGVFVSDKPNADSTKLMDIHGQHAQPFGTHPANDTANLNVFVNDRIAKLCGAVGESNNEIVWDYAEKMDFTVQKTWSKNGEVIDANDASLQNRKVYFELYKVSGGTEASFEHPETILPEELLVDGSNEAVWPTQELSEYKSNNDQNHQVELSPAGGFFYYDSANDENDGWYIILVDKTENVNQVWDGPSSAWISNSNTGVKFTGTFVDFDAWYELHSEDHASNEHIYYNTNFGNTGDRPWCLKDMHRGDLVLYKGVYYAVWNPTDNPVSEWGDGTKGIGNIWFSIKGSGGSSTPSTPPVIEYTSQDAAEGEKDSLDGYKVEGIPSSTTGDDANNHGVNTESVQVVAADGTTTTKDLYVIDSSDINWTKTITNLDAKASYYVVEWRVTETSGDGSPENDISIKHRSGGKGTFLVTYAYSQDAQRAVINNDYVSAAGGIEVGFAKVDGFGNALTAENMGAVNTAIGSTGTDDGSLRRAKFQLFAMGADGKATGSAVDLTVGDSTTTEITANDAGEVRFGVANGVYVMKETQTPNGFVENTNEYAVVVGEDYMNLAELQKQGAAASMFANVTAEGLNAQNKAQIGMKLADGSNAGDKNYAIFRIDSSGGKARALAAPDVNSYGLLNTSARERKVVIRKVGVDGQTVSDDTTLQPLAGAEFTLYNADMSVREEKIGASTDIGLTFVDDLPLGTYYLEETKAPNADGYGASVGNRYRIEAKEDGNTAVSERLGSEDAAKRNVVVTSAASPVSGGTSVASYEIVDLADSYGVGETATARLQETYEGKSSILTGISWSVEGADASGNPVATIDAGGKLTFNSKGKATVIAKLYGDELARKTVTVTGAVERATLDTTVLFGGVGGTGTIAVTVTNGGNSIDASVVASRLSYTVADTSIATIAKGTTEVSFHGTGETTIEVIYTNSDGESSNLGKVSVTVKPWQYGIESLSSEYRAGTTATPKLVRWVEGAEGAKSEVPNAEWSVTAADGTATTAATIENGQIKFSPDVDAETMVKVVATSGGTTVAQEVKVTPKGKAGVAILEDGPYYIDDVIHFVLYDGEGHSASTENVAWAMSAKPESGYEDYIDYNTGGKTTLKKEGKFLITVKMNSATDTNVPVGTEASIEITVSRKHYTVVAPQNPVHAGDVFDIMLVYGNESVKLSDAPWAYSVGAGAPVTIAYQPNGLRVLDNALAGSYTITMTLNNDQGFAKTGDTFTFELQVAAAITASITNTSALGESDSVTITLDKDTAKEQSHTLSKSVKRAVFDVFDSENHTVEYSVTGSIQADPSWPITVKAGDTITVDMPADSSVEYELDGVVNWDIQYQKYKIKTPKGIEAGNYKITLTFDREIDKAGNDVASGETVTINNYWLNSPEYVAMAHAVDGSVASIISASYEKL